MPLKDYRTKLTGVGRATLTVAIPWAPCPPLEEMSWPHRPSLFVSQLQMQREYNQLPDSAATPFTL